MATTPAGIVYPALTNAPNVPADLQAMANSLDPNVIPNVATAAARAAAITAPVVGQLTYRVDGKCYEQYDGAGWTPLAGYVWGEASSAGSATLTTAVTNVAVDSTNKVTITITATKRILVEAQANFTAATAPARYSIIPAYTAGSSVGAITVIGNTVRVPVSTTGAPGLNTGDSRQSVVLAAGTYTFFVAAARDNGGSATDTASSPTVRVIDGGLA